MNWINKLLGRKQKVEKEERIPSWPEVQYGIEKQMALHRQEWEDRKWADEIETRARRRLHEWKSHLRMQKMYKDAGHAGWEYYAGIMSIEPIMCVIYELHDEQTAKYKNVNIHDEIHKRFTELKEEYEQSQETK